MSNRPKLKPPLRNLVVLLARARAEVGHGLTGVNIMRVEHDDWCRAVETHSMLDCQCSPVMQVEPALTADTGADEQ